MSSEPPNPARTPRRTQEQRREQTASALLAAAAELVVESGVHSLTLARVGERAGYSRGVITHRFGSKQALVDALAKSAQRGFLPDIADLPPGLDRLVLLVAGYLGRLDESVTGRAFLLLWAEAATAPELSAIFRERDEAFREDLRSDVAAGIADGTIRPDADPHDVATAVLGQLRGIGMQYLLAPNAIDPKRLGRSAADQWRRALAAPGATHEDCR